MPKVSIILPVYGVEKYLQRCMDSIFGQTLKDIEIIMVDDGSPDNCPKMCDEYARQDERVKVIHKENAGLGYARNSGLEVATGEYVAFVDSDDFVEKNAYETLYNEAKASAADAVFADSYVELPNKEWDKRQFVNEKDIIRGNKVKDFALDMIAGDVKEKADRRYPMSVWRLIYKKEIIDKNCLRFLSERDIVSEDLPFQIDFFMHADSVVLLPYSFYHYCLNGESLTSTFDPAKYDRFRKLYEIIKGKVSQLDGGYLRADRFLIYYTRYHVMDMLKAKYSDQLNHVKHIINDPVWKVLRQEYKPSYLPPVNRIFYWLLLHKQALGVISFAALVNYVKKIKGRR